MRPQSLIKDDRKKEREPTANPALSGEWRSETPLSKCKTNQSVPLEDRLVKARHFAHYASPEFDRFCVCVCAECSANLNAHSLSFA